MTKLTKTSLGVMALLLSSALFGVIWARNPQLFPGLNLSDEAWLRIIEATGANKFNAEIIAAIFFGSIISGVILVAIYVLHLGFKRLTKNSSGR